MKQRTSVNPTKEFIYGIHKPDYNVTNLRGKARIAPIGSFESGTIIDNQRNYPQGDVTVKNSDWIFEIPNPLSFRGSTYIDKEWADASARNPQKISLAQKKKLSLSRLLENENISTDLFHKLPSPLLLTLATSSTDPQDLIRLAEISCDFSKDAQNKPTGLLYSKSVTGGTRPIIHNHPLFEAVANNPELPDTYKIIMVLRPGAQGESEIVGEFDEDDSGHIYEYLRRNSYIAHGHYAANMSDDAVRYSIDRLTETDMTGLRHLYYQRTYVRLATLLDIDLPTTKQSFSDEKLENLRLQIQEKLQNNATPALNATLWGWNFGFDYAASGYRLHASHQQIHQQYAMVPQYVETYSGDPHHSTGEMYSFTCGDMVAEVIHTYKRETGADFFSDYISCIRNNKRMDGENLEGFASSLIIWEDKHAMLFVPKAQTSQWEIQLMALKNNSLQVVGNIVEADSATRASLNHGILLAQKALAGLGARMVTSIEYPKRPGKAGAKGQHLLYSFLPRLPQSPGAFSEAQLRYINGHYPEDFAAVCRKQISSSQANELF